jgi:adenosylhomocysteine nucleosidase
VLTGCAEELRHRCGPWPHIGPIASGDEDVVDAERRTSIHARTGALAAAWEGAGGARACAFLGVPFLEIRGITDSADAQAATSFRLNTPPVMARVAEVLRALGACVPSVPVLP